MDLKEFFKRIREIEAAIPDVYTLVVSLVTPDGGKAGVMTETPRGIAATLIAEGRARLATPTEITAHEAQMKALIAEADKAAFADRVQVALVSDFDFEGLKQKSKTKKS